MKTKQERTNKQEQKKIRTFLTAPGLSCNMLSFKIETNSCCFELVLLLLDSSFLCRVEKQERPLDIIVLLLLLLLLLWIEINGNLILEVASRDEVGRNEDHNMI